MTKLAGVPLDDPQGACHMGVDQSPSNLAPASRVAKPDAGDLFGQRRRELNDRLARAEAMPSGMQRRYALEDIWMALDALEEDREQEQ